MVVELRHKGEEYGLEHLVGETDLSIDGIAKSVVTTWRDAVKWVIEKIYNGLQLTYSKIEDSGKYLQNPEGWEYNIIQHHDRWVENIRKNNSLKKSLKDLKKKEKKIIYDTLVKDKKPKLFAWILSRSTEVGTEGVKRGLELTASQTAVYHSPKIVYWVSKTFKLNEMRMYRDGLVSEIALGFPAAVSTYYGGFERGDLISSVINYFGANIPPLNVPEDLVMSLTLTFSAAYFADTIRKYTKLKKRERIRGWNNYINPSSWLNTAFMLSLEVGVKTWDASIKTWEIVKKNEKDQKYIV